MISMDSVPGSETVRCREAAGSPASLPPPRGWLLEESWQERDSGLELQAAEGRGGEEASLGLLQLMERYRASVELSRHTDAATGAAGKLSFC